MSESTAVLFFQAKQNEEISFSLPPPHHHCLCMQQFHWQIKSHCLQSLPLMFLCLFSARCLHKKCVRLPICFDMMVCHQHTFQNEVPLTQDEVSSYPDEHKPLWSSNYNSQVDWLGYNIYMHEIRTLCAVGGWHRCALFCVEEEGFHIHLAPSCPDHTLCNSGQVSSAKCSSWVGQQEHHPLTNLHLLMDHLHLVVSEVSSNRVGPNAIGIPPYADWSPWSLLPSNGGIGPWKWCRSFMWHGTPLTLIKWWLNTPVTHPSLNLVVHWLPRVFIETGSPTAGGLRLFSLSGVCTVWILFLSNLVPVNGVCRCSC